MRRFLTLCLSAVSLMTAAPTMAAEIRLLTAGAFKPIVLELAAEFEKQSGHKLVVDNDTAGALLRRIGSGEAFDVAILTPAAVKDLTSAGKIAPGTSIDLARTGVGVAVKDGAPKPDITTLETFKAALVAAKKVAYIDPAAGGSSGIYFTNLLGKLGLTETVQAKAVLVPGGLVAQKLVTGEADLAIHQISEILAVKGATLVGPLPAEIQNYTVYTGGVGSAALQPEAAKALLAFLSGEAGKRVLVEKGMDSPPR